MEFENAKLYFSQPTMSKRQLSVFQSDIRDNRERGRVDEFLQDKDSIRVNSNNIN